MIDSETSFQINPRILQYGQYIAEVTVSLANDGEISNRQVAFFEVVPSDLVAQISGGNEETIRQGSYFTINGSGSHDPDVDPQREDDALSFIWFCHLGNESSDGGEGKQYLQMDVESRGGGMGEEEIMGDQQYSNRIFVVFLRNINWWDRAM